MSGVKDTYVQIRQSELDRIRASCRRADNVEEEISQRVNQAATQLQKQHESQLQQTQKRHENMEKSVASMNGEMHQMETKHQQRVKQLSKEYQDGLGQLNAKMTSQSREYQQELGNLGQRMDGQRREYIDLIQQQGAQFNTKMEGQRREYFNLIEEQSKHFDSALLEQRNELQGQIQHVQAQFVAKEKNEQQQAQTWLHDTRCLMEGINKTYQHQKFAPNQLSSLQANLSFVESNIKSGVYQAAIATCQNTYIQAQQLHMELERLTLEWNAYLSVARQSAVEVLAFCDAQIAAKFTFDTQEGAEEIAAEVDYWTNDGLKALRNEVVITQEQLKQPSELTLDDLKDIISKSNTYQQRTETLTEQARMEIIASQVRCNIAELIEASLKEAAFECTDSAWEGEDQRQALHVKFENPSGDELVTIIYPERTDERSVRNRVNIHFFDKRPSTENLRQTRLASIVSNLQKQEINCEPPRCAVGTENRERGNEERLDFEKVRAVKQ